METRMTIRPPKILYRIFSRSTWRFNDGLVRLTFDDGPGPLTEKLLHWLGDHNYKGYFFVMPDQIEKYNNLALEILQEGHEIGVHFNHHKPYWAEQKKMFINDLTIAKDRLETGLNHKINICRAPYGRILPMQEKWIEEIGMEHWFWSVSSKDYRNEDKNIVINRLKKYILPGDIVLFHDGYIISDNIIEILENVKGFGLSIEKLS